MIIALTPGCPAGIGPEIAAAAVADAVLPEDTTLWWASSPALFCEGSRRAGRETQVDGNLVRIGNNQIRCAISDAQDPGVGVVAGQPNAAALDCQRDALLRAVEAGERQEVDGLVTAPIRKACLDDIAGGPFPGHTELLAARLSAQNAPMGQRPLMCFVGGPFLLSLCTIHLPLRQVADSITPALLDARLSSTLAAAVSLGALGSKKHPKVVVLALNPHAGEGGLLGHDEEELLIPAIARANARHSQADFVGPLPADGFFADVARRGAAACPDAVLAMYHDQGLAPYKLLTHDAGVNYTFGLTLPRTSPDHGTADAIAGKGRADAGSMKSALQLCLDVASRRSGRLL